MSKFSVKKPFTVVVAVILVIILGVVSFTNMTPDLLPNIEMPMVIVVTTYPGASPAEVEEQITKPLEQSMATLENIKTIGSTSSDNVSILMLEFDDGVNMDTVTVNMREKIDIVKAAWPDLVGSPFILKINPDILPVTVASVDCEGMSTVELSTFVKDELLPELEGTEGVASISVNGLVQESIYVVLNDEKIAEQNARIQQAILDEFGGYESQIWGGINSAAGGLNAANAGKQQLVAGQEELARQLYATRIQLENARAQLIALQIAAPVLEPLLTQVVSWQTYNANYYGTVAAANPGWTHDQVVAECMLDPTYAGNAQNLTYVDTMLTALGYTLADVPDILLLLPTLAEKIAAIDTALAELAIQETVLSSQLNNLYADAAAGAAALQLTIAQLRTTLTSLEGQRQAALSTADLTGMISVSLISQLLTAQNFSMPAGYIGADDGQYLVSVGDKIASVDELKQLVLLDIGVEDVAPILLSDVADIFVMDNAAQVYAKINGHDGVLLSFSKQSGYATATVSEHIGERFDELAAQHEGLNFVPLMDQGDYIGVVVGTVLNNLLIGAILAILILFLFLRDWRPTFITACSIPISVTFAIVLMYFSGVTLNVISLAGLAVGVGMLVDNSIVVIENIYRLRSLGQSPVRAAISGASQVAAAITSSTLTTVCVFFPIVFVQGLTRQLFVDMALTIAYSLLASLVVALTLVPAMASGMLKKEAKAVTEESRYGRFIQKYKTSIQYALDHKVLFIVVSIALLAISTVWSISKGFQFMPEMSGTEIMISAEMPEDYTLEQTVAKADKMAQDFNEIEGVSTVGAMQMESIASVIGISAGSGNVTSVTLYVILDGSNTKRVIRDINEVCDRYEEVETMVTSTSSMMSFGSLGGDGVSLRLYGDDIDALRTAALDIRDVIAGVEGIDTVTTAAEESQPEVRIIVDKNKAMEYSLTVAQVYLQVSQTLAKSQTPTEIVYEGESHDVIIQSDAVAQMTLDDLHNMTFTVTSQFTGESQVVALTDIATIEIRETLSAISRSEQRRYVSVSATLEEGYNISLVSADVQAALADYALPAGVSMEYTGENESIMEALKDLLLLLFLGIIIVYLIMVAQFQSLLSPFIVMFTIPLAFTGGLFALIISGLEISIVAMIGFIMLVGVIVNNGIVLIDYMNQLRADGVERREAIIDACVTRLRPVIMTALTTILGLLPLAIGMGTGAELMQPVAVVCIGGLTYATVMTLYIVPIMYDVFIKKEPRVVTEEDLQIVDL